MNPESKSAYKVGQKHHSLRVQQFTIHPNKDFFGFINQLMDQPLSVDTLWISQFVTGSLRELVGATISDHHPFICDCFVPQLADGGMFAC